MGIKQSRLSGTPISLNGNGLEEEDLRTGQKEVLTTVGLKGGDSQKTRFTITKSRKFHSCVKNERDCSYGIGVRGERINVMSKGASSEPNGGRSILSKEGSNPSREEEGVWKEMWELNT